MYRKLLIMFLILLIFNYFINCKTIKSSTKKLSKLTKSIKYSNSNKLLNKPLNNKLMFSLSDNLMSNIKLDEIIEPIKKLTRKRMVKLLIKSIKRVNKNTKNKLKENKSNESIKNQLPIEQKNDLNKQIKHTANYFDTQTFNQPKSVIATKLDNDLNKNELNSKVSIISDTSLIKKRKEDSVEDNSFKLTSQYLNSNNPTFLKSIDQTVNLFNNELHNSQFENIYSLIDNSNYLHSNLYQLNNQDNLNNEKEVYFSDKYDPLIRNQDEIIKINIPMNELIHYPIFINDQINSTRTQNFIKNFLKSQFSEISSRSDSRRKLTGKLLNFLAKQLDIEQTDRKDIALQTGITKILGTFIGDIAGVVVEEILHKRGDKVADHIRTRIGDIATLLINKSNLVLEMTFRNLSKLLIKRKLN